MLTHKLTKFWQWLNSPPSAPPRQTLAWTAGSTENPTAFSEQLHRLQDSLLQANRPLVVVENSLQ
jgi:hypothetical protein